MKIAIHLQIIVDPGRKNRGRGFKFEKEWLQDEECANVVKEAWQLVPIKSVNGKLAICVNRPRDWSAKRPTDFKPEIEKRRDHMHELIGLKPTIAILEKVREVDNEIDELKKREEVYWSQRSGQDWLRDGDENMAFFS